MQNDYENLAKVLMASPQGAKIVKSLDKLNSVVNTESGRQLIAMLASDGGDAIKNAAALLSSPEGAQLAAKIIEVVGR